MNTGSLTQFKKFLYYFNSFDYMKSKNLKLKEWSKTENFNFTVWFNKNK